MLKPMSEEAVAKKIQDELARIRSRPRMRKPCERDTPANKIACARQANFAARSATIEADVVVDVPGRGRVLVVEVTWFREPSIAKAIGHRDVRAPFWTTDFDYFMLVLRDDIYIWKWETPLGNPPDFAASVQSVWSRYLGDLAQKPEALIGEVMEMAVVAWLFDLINDLRPLDPESEADQALLTSGLYQHMKNGDVDTHVQA